MRGTGIVAQHSPERKGRRRAIRIVLVFVLAATVSLPIAFIAGALMTPVLWKLEPVLGFELAGHSGPSDWIVLTLSAVVTVGVTVLYARITRPKAAESAEQTG